jgi:hypothetical protein
VAEGTHCPLAARGCSRDGKKGRLQIEYGLLTDPHGRPVAVRVFPGNTGDPAAFTQIVTVLRNKFGLASMVMVEDRGMITSAPAPVEVVRTKPASPAKRHVKPTSANRTRRNFGLNGIGPRPPCRAVGAAAARSAGYAPRKARIERTHHGPFG